MQQPFITRKTCADWARSTIAAAALAATLLGADIPAPAQQVRALGIDISTYQGDISTANWATLKRPIDQQVGGLFGDGRDFVLIRASRGGTTGEDHRQGGYPVGNNTLTNLSRRYDDPYFVQNINRATSAGLFAGSYHFARPDILATTPNTDGTTAGISNNGTDEADHFVQMAGAWMRPGYLPPVLDLEAGDGIRSDNEMAQFCTDFSDRIYAVTGIRPAIYVNGNYAAFVLATATTPTPGQVVSSFPTLWSARWPNQTNVSAIPVQTGHPKDSYAAIYGPWDDAPNPAHPWRFWQYASTARLNGYANGGANIDVDVAQGGMEFLKDCLVPALWMNNADGQWTTLSNWNSGQTPNAPATGAGQLAPIGTQTLPTPRLPGINDTVILERPGGNLSVTLASGTHAIRKLYMREALNITGGTLAVNYVPSWDSTTNAAQFSGPVTLSGSGSLSLHTLQVDAAQTFTLGGGTLTFNSIALMPHTSVPAKILMSGNVNFNALSNNATATIARGAGSGNSGLLDFGGGIRTFTVADNSTDADLSVDVPISNGGLSKAGPGTMRLSSANTYSSGTTVSAGRLLVNNAIGSGAGSGGVTVAGGTLGGTGTISGAVTVNIGGTVSPGTAASIGKLTLNSAPSFNGTNLMRIDRNGGSPLADKIVLSAGTLTYGGTLVVSNAGAALTGGEVFTNFVAGAYSGAFAAAILPGLNGGLNWHLGNLAANGSIRVNRSPIANPMTFTNVAPLALQIPLASLTANGTDADGDAITLTGINLTTTNGITLLTNNSFLVYSNYVSSSDRFSYTINDGHGGSATGTVYIASSPTGRFAGAPSGNASSVTLHFAGRPGWTYYLERSTNLPVWLAIWTNTAPAGGVFDYTDDFHDLPAPPSAAIYRLRWSP